uniref:Pirin-like n=1 Tax=Saccoglossus kowalevskii TaxID=10224 RepID=A0ABM0MDQ7_SACKO|nr:PREDICTED: pirin-like [Saccoglossus kowalevskii]
MLTILKRHSLMKQLVVFTRMLSSVKTMERKVVDIITAPQQYEGGGFLVRRPIGGKLPQVDPFVLLDHFGPAVFKPGEAIGAPDHPHRGFETVSYIIEGSMQHKDSLGNKGNLKSGWVQWMTAGSGVVHSEMPSDDIMKNGGKLEGFQLWVNLPAKDKMIAPRYQDTPNEKIPVATTPDGKVKVKIIAGKSLGAEAVIETRTPIMYLDIRLQPGARFTQDVPESYNGFVYVWKGAGYLGNDEKTANMGQVGILTSGSVFTDLFARMWVSEVILVHCRMWVSEVILVPLQDVGVRSNTGTSAGCGCQKYRVILVPLQDVGVRSNTGTTAGYCHVILAAGVPLKEPVVQHGPFVMNTETEIQQAMKDYRSGKLGSIPGSEERFAQTEAAKQKQHISGT